ncbi:MAG: autotransporter-associated beta strand repeat-containing protein [Pirellulales bacterium]
MGGAGNGSITSSITGTAGVTKNDSGTWTLAGANTNNGPLTVNSGTLQLGDGTTGSWNAASNLNVGGDGRFVYHGTTTGSAQSLNVLTFNAGQGAVQSTYGTSGNTQLTFASLTIAGGATGNFIVSGGANGTTNRITITGATPDSFLNAGAYFNGADFAYNDATGFVRALNYGVDLGTNIVAAAAELAAGHNVINSSSGTTGVVTQSAPIIVNSLKLSGATTLTTGGLVTVQTAAGASGGIIAAGGASVINGTAGISTSGAGALVVNVAGGTDSLTIAAPIDASTTGGLIKAGAGTLLLTGTNAYSGATTVNGGILTLGSAAALGATTSLAVNTGGTLNLAGQSTTLGVTISGSGAGGVGALVNNSGTAVQVGAITLGTAAAIGGTGSILSTAALPTNANLLTKVGSGTLIFGTASARTGATRVDGGVLRLQNASNVTPIGTGPIVLGGGGVSLGFDAANATINGAIVVAANSSIEVDRFTSGAGVLNTLGTSLIIGSQTLTVRGGANVASGTAALTIGGTTTSLVGNAGFDVQSPIAAGTSTTLTMGALNDLGVARTITFQNSGSSATNSQVNLGTAAGSLIDGTAVNINGGPSAGVTVNLNIAAALGTLAQVTVSGNSVLNIGAAQTIGSLAGDGTVVANAGAAQTLTIGNGNSSVVPTTTFSGSLNNGTQTLNIAKLGNGTLILSGNNSYGGTTTVSGGILRLGSATALGNTSGVTINNTGTVDLNGQTTSRNFTIGGATTSAGGTLISSTGTGTITGTTALGAAAQIGGAGNVFINNAGGLTGNVLLTKIGVGTLTIQSTATSARTGVNQIDGGTLRLQATTNITPVGTGAFTLNGGTLSLGFDIANATITGAINVIANSTIVVDRNTPGAGFSAVPTITLGALNIGGSTLTVVPGSNVTSGFHALTLGSTTIGGAAMSPGNPTIDVQSTAAANTTLVLGAISDQGIAPRTITFTNTGVGTQMTNVNLATAAGSLIDGTVVNVNSGPNAGVSVNLNIAAALGTLAQVNVNGSSRVTLGAAQTIGSLGGNGTVNLATFALTVGNTANSQAYNTNFSGQFTGTTGALTKNSISTLTLSGALSNTNTGATTVNTGTLVLAKTGGAIAVPGNLVIGAAGGASGNATVRLDGNNQIVTNLAAATLTINAGGTLDLNGFNQQLSGAALSPWPAAVSSAREARSTSLRRDR